MATFPIRHLNTLSILLNIPFLLGFIHLIATLHGSFDVRSLSMDEVQNWKELAAQVPLDPSSNGGKRSCEMCDVNPALCAQLGEDKVNRAVSFMGTNARLRRVLQKMRRGEPWTMGVIGGSVSCGQGISWGNGKTELPQSILYKHPNMHRVIFDHLDTRFPSSSPLFSRAMGLAEASYTDEMKSQGTLLIDVTARSGPIDQDLKSIPIDEQPFTRAYGFSAKQLGVNSMINGAQGGTGSDYFSYCFREHVGDEVDLVVVELGINDEDYMPTVDTYETLLRGLLDLPGQPAVIGIHNFALMFRSMLRGGHLHKGLNEYYDIPSISTRNAFLDDILTNHTAAHLYFKPDKEGEYPVTEINQGLDLRHLSNYAHNLTGHLMGTYIDTQICAMERDGQFEEGHDIQVPGLPRLRLNTPFSLSPPLPPFRPTCLSTTSLLHPLVPLSSTPFDDVNGWYPWAWKNKKYIVSHTPGSRISFAIGHVGVGIVNMSYQRSRKYGLGYVECWIEGVPKGEDGQVEGEGKGNREEQGTRVQIQGYWEHDHSVLQTHTWKDVSPGEHILTCELLERV